MIIPCGRTMYLSRGACVGFARRLISKVSPDETSNYTPYQVDYLKSAIEKKRIDWNVIKTDILTKKGNMNEKNLDAVLLKYLVNHHKFNHALSFADYLKNSKELNLGSTNAILLLYAELKKERQLSIEEQSYMLETYNYLYDKYKVLDSTTCERLLHALCAIDEWEKARKTLEDILLSSQATHSAYSTLIATLFRVNKEADAMKLIVQSIENKRPLQFVAYEGWIEYILRKHKDKEIVVKCLEDVCEHIAKYCETVDLETAKLLKDTFAKFGWSAQYTKIGRQKGECETCKKTLDCLKLTEEEFQLLQKTVKDRLIVGSDLFLKSSPDELKKFISFIENTAPYDVVIDALNIAYAVGVYKDKIGYLNKVVDHFRRQDKKILLLGRKHMMKWPKINNLIKVTSSFFTDNLSQDDPYFITAAILSGSHTDVVSKDLLRGHRFLLRDQHLQGIFQRWQWQHQWKVFVRHNWTPFVQEPLPITPCAQKKHASWHLPFAREDLHTAGQVRDGAPDWNSWLCLRPPNDVLK